MISTKREGLNLRFISTFPSQRFPSLKAHLFSVHYLTESIITFAFNLTSKYRPRSIEVSWF